MRSALTLLVASLSLAAAACAADAAPTTAGRFDDPKVDEVVTSKPAKPQTERVPGGEPTSEADDRAVTAPAETPAGSGTEAPTPTEAPATTCLAPRDLGVIAADDEEARVSAEGTCSTWLTIRAQETNHSVLTDDMRLRATLVSPEGANFDLFLYVDKDNDTRACSTVTAKSELPAGRHDIASLTWGEYYTANASDDSRHVSIEVRAKDPSACGKGKWVLVLEGDR